MNRENFLRNLLYVAILIIIALILIIFFGFKFTGLNVGPIALDAPTSIPLTLQPDESLPSSTPLPSGAKVESLGSIRVFGNSSQGLQITIPKTGIYRFAYREGAYSPYPVGGAPKDYKPWLTAVYIYSGDHASWDGTVISYEGLLLRIADMGYWLMQEEAESAARGQFLDFRLNEGDILTLIAVDHLDAYSDNPGEVLLELSFVTY